MRPIPYFTFDHSPQNCARLRRAFADSHDAVELAQLTPTGIQILERPRTIIVRATKRYRVFDGQWHMHVARREAWQPVDIPGGGMAMARLVSGVVQADALIDGPHPDGTELEASEVDDFVQPGTAQILSLKHLDVDAGALTNPPVEVCYDIQSRGLTTEYVDGYIGADDPAYVYLVQNTGIQVDDPRGILPLPDGPQKQFWDANAHRIRRARDYSIMRRHNCTPHGGTVLPITTPKPKRRPFARVTIKRPHGHAPAAPGGRTGGL